MASLLSIDNFFQTQITITFFKISCSGRKNGVFEKYYVLEVLKKIEKGVLLKMVGTRHSTVLEEGLHSLDKKKSWPLLGIETKSFGFPGYDVNPIPTKG